MCAHICSVHWCTYMYEMYCAICFVETEGSGSCFKCKDPWGSLLLLARAGAIQRSSGSCLPPGARERHGEKQRSGCGDSLRTKLWLLELHFVWHLFLYGCLIFSSERSECHHDAKVVVSRLPLFSEGRLNTIRIVKAEGLRRDGYNPFGKDDE